MEVLVSLDHILLIYFQKKVREIIIFDNFCRGRIKNLQHSLKDKVKIYDNGGDITQLDILENAMEKVDGAFHFAALWLLHCWDYPESVFDVNIKGTFNVVRAVMKCKVKRIVYSRLPLFMVMHYPSLWMKVIHLIIIIFTELPK